MIRSARGSVLIVSLIFLLLMTIVGLSAMNMSNLDERMAGNYKDHQMAFQAAEAALVEAEGWVNSTNFTLADFFTNPACTPSAAGTCFSSTCSFGLCSPQEFVDAGAPAADCKVGELSGSTWSSPGNRWENWAFWKNAAKVRTASTVTGTITNARYIVEFQCFIPKDPTNSNPSTADFNQWSPSFRITVLANGSTADSQVMLQSLFKKLDL